jgi:hypothetical protein
MVAVLLKRRSDREGVAGRPRPATPGCLAKPLRKRFSTLAEITAY